MIRGMTFFHGDKNSATSGADFSSSSQGALDSRAVIGDLHNPGREKNRIVRGSWPQHFDGVLRSDRAGRPIPASAFHQMICCRPIIPPFRTPLKASYFFSGFHSATTSPFFAKLRICKPFGFAGPQPKQMFRGAYFSWSDCSICSGGL